MELAITNQWRKFDNIHGSFLLSARNSEIPHEQRKKRGSIETFPKNAQNQHQGSEHCISSEY